MARFHLQTEEGNATAIRPDAYDSFRAINLSVWGVARVAPDDPATEVKSMDAAFCEWATHDQI